MSGVNDKTQLCELFQISEDEVASRKRFVGLDENDERALQRIKVVLSDHVDDVIKDFYEHLMTFPELRRVLADQRTIERLRSTQRDYLMSLGDNSDDLRYFENRLRIGVTHEKIGLSQKWYLGGYAQLFALISKRLIDAYSDSPDEVYENLSALQKFFTLDSILAVETYYQATMRRLEAILTQLNDAHRHLEEVSRLDGLTGLSNRRFVMESIDMEFYRSRRFKHPFALLLIDVDHFKAINDTRGHGAGDTVLRRTAQAIREVLRPSDIVGRYGGEEFVVGLVESPRSTAELVAERIRLKVAHMKHDFEGEALGCTVSIGGTELTGETESVEELLRNSDTALYQSKSNGRNCVTFK